jgi:ABC-type thiamin/hydroxymethylpyrimidine transport system permease subunit
VSASPTPKRPWNLPLRARVTIALIAALIIAAKFYLRMPIHVPGHSGVLWMALLVVGVGSIRRPGVGTLIGFITAVLATILLPGKEGLLVGVKYLVPGITFDLLLPLLGGRLDRYPTAIALGAAAHASKLVASYLVGLAAGISADYLALGLGPAATLHVVFGALGGALGALVLKRLNKSGVLAGISEQAPSGEAVP